MDDDRRLAVAVRPDPIVFVLSVAIGLRVRAQALHDATATVVATST